jgi:hypothetical protein
MVRTDPQRHNGIADAAPRGEDGKRRPGELIFAGFLLIASLYLLWTAYGIENPFGPNGLSSPRSIPLATTAVMVISAGLILFKTAKRPLDRSGTIATDIFPPVVLLFALFLIAYGIALRPLGFLPTSALFLIAATKILAKRSWIWTLSVSLGGLIVIWLTFRVIFSVLMPAGIVPEAEFIQFFRGLRDGGAGQ